NHNAVLDAGDLSGFGGEPLYVQPHGGGSYAYLLTNEWGQFAISGGDGLRGKPTIRGRLSSAYLHSAPSESTAEMEHWITAAMSARLSDRPQVSEAHYHVDLTGWEPQVDA